MRRSLWRAWRSMREHTYLSLVSTGVITAGLLLVGLYAFAVANLRAMAGVWDEDVHVSAYIDPGLAADSHPAVQQAIAGRPEVETVRYVSQVEAAAWMRSRMPDVGPVLDELGEGALPASLEITLRGAHTQPEAVAAFVTSIQQGGTFTAIDYGQEWMARFGALLSVLTATGVVFGAFVGLASLFLVANTIHLVVWSRRDELEIMRLVGATDAYILSPFVVEGAVQGLFASTIALLAIWGVHRGLAVRLQEVVTVAMGEGGLLFLPVGWVVALFAAGLLLGVGAPWGAVRRFLAKLP